MTMLGYMAHQTATELVGYGNMDKRQHRDKSNSD